MAPGFFSKRIFATNRAATGRIWTILRRSRAGPRGHILGPFPAPGGPKKSPEKIQKLLGKIFFFLKILEPTIQTGEYSRGDAARRRLREGAPAMALPRPLRGPRAQGAARTGAAAARPVAVPSPGAPRLLFSRVRRSAQNPVNS